MESNGDVRIRPMSKSKRTKLAPLPQDPFRRSTTGFGVSDSSKALQKLMEENERLKTELEAARKEIFQLKEENLELKKQARPSTKSGNSTFLTSASTYGQNGGLTEEDKNSGDVL